VNKRPPKNGEIQEKKQHTLLVDGNALFKTGYFGAKDMYNSKGEHIGGIYQFFTVIRKLLTEDLYHRVYVFWDGKFSGKLRYELYEPYKSDRGKDYINGSTPEENELRQLKKIWNYLNELYVRQLRDEVIESDDFIAYYCKYKKSNEKITVCTNDTDIAQVIDTDIRIYYLHLKKYVDISNFSSYFRYKLENTALVKIMIGDSADSIKGIKGLGLTTLLNHVPELNERAMSLDEVILIIKEKQDERISNKKKPLTVFNNIINSVTDGVQGNKIYEINESIVSLEEPKMTKNGIDALRHLMENTLDSSGREIKKVYEYLKIDEIDKSIGEFRMEDYLVPFKSLISREKLIF